MSATTATDGQARGSRAATAFTVLVLVWLALDQLTKTLVVRAFAEPGRVYRALVPDYLELSYMQNPGAAFSLLRDHPGSRYLLILVAAGALGVLFGYRRAITALPWPQWVGLALVAGGAAGNLADRIARGGLVVDFIHCPLHFGKFVYMWPDFNVADIGVTCGMCLYVVHALLTERELMRQQAADAQP